MDERNFSAKSRVSFGVRVPNSGPLASPDSIVQVGREAESLGYDSIWVHDHLTWTEEIHSTHISSGSEDSNTGGSSDFYEAMTTLAYLAGLVRSVRLGVACLVVPCRNPLLTAKQIASLDVFCNGRLDIGLGIGSPSTLKSREYEVIFSLDGGCFFSLKQLGFFGVGSIFLAYFSRSFLDTLRFSVFGLRFVEAAQLQRRLFEHRLPPPCVPPLDSLPF